MVRPPKSQSRSGLVQKQGEEEEDGNEVDEEETALRTMKHLYWWMLEELD